MRTSSGVTVRVFGDAALRRKMRKIGEQAVGHKHRIALLAGAEIIRTAAVRNVHSKLNKDASGDLARSITIEADRVRDFLGRFVDIEGE